MYLTSDSSKLKRSLAPVAKITELQSYNLLCSFAVVIMWRNFDDVLLEFRKEKFFEVRMF